MTNGFSILNWNELQSHSTTGALLPRTKWKLLEIRLSGNYFAKFAIQQFMQYFAGVFVNPIAVVGTARRWCIIESLWTATRRTQPDLLIWRLFIYHVNAVSLSQVHCQYSILNETTTNMLWINCRRKVLKWLHYLIDNISCCKLFKFLS